MAVGGVGSSSSNLEVETKKLDEQKAAQQTDRKTIEDQMSAQSQQQGSGAIQQYIAQIRAAQLQAQQNNAGNPLGNFSVDTQMKARSISQQVVGEMLKGMPSQQSAQAQGGSTNTGGGTSTSADELIRTAVGGTVSTQNSGVESAAGAEGGGGLGKSDSKMEGDAADKNIQDAAKVAVYNDIYQLLQKMQNTRAAKSDLAEKMQSINEKLAGKKSGDKVQVPVYEMDEATGQAKFKGYKEMDYDSAVTMRDKLGDAKDSMNEMSQNDMFYLQQAMEQKSQLEQMISNVMKANSETQSGLAGNLKAS